MAIEDLKVGFQYLSVDEQIERLSIQFQNILQFSLARPETIEEIGKRLTKKFSDVPGLRKRIRNPIGKQQSRYSMDVDISTNTVLGISVESLDLIAEIATNIVGDTMVDRDTDMDSAKLMDKLPVPYADYLNCRKCTMMLIGTSRILGLCRKCQLKLGLTKKNIFISMRGAMELRKRGVVESCLKLSQPGNLKSKVQSSALSVERIQKAWAAFDEFVHIGINPGECGPVNGDDRYTALRDAIAALGQPQRSDTLR